MADLNANKIDSMLNALNEAMEIHAQNAIKNLPFNKTELAEIVDITKRDEGWYIVWNGSTRYMAFSENTSYKMGAKVYVNIPNNNFDNQKIIVGQQVSENEQSIFFRSPLAGYQPMTDNILSMGGDNIPNEYGLVANWSGVGLIQGQQIIEIFSSDSLTENSSYSGYKYLAISANIKTALEKTTIGGNYGIKVVIEGIKKQDVTTDVVLEQRNYYLDTKNMIGSVYNFDTYYKQEALFDISDFDQLSAILVVVYQDGTFKDNENNLLPHTFRLTETADEQVRNPNIFIKDIEITFGEDAESGRDGLKLKTLNGKSYNSSQKDSLNEKNLYLEWTHLNPDTEEKQKITNRSEAVKMSDIGNYVIHWYRDSLQSTSDYTYIIESLQAEANADRAMAAYDDWKEIESGDYTDEEKQAARNKVVATFNLNLGTDYIIAANNTIEIQSRGISKIEGAISSSRTKTTPASDNLAGAYWREIATGQSQWEYNRFLPDTSRQYTRVKVIIEYWSDESISTPNPNNEGYTRIESNEIQFNNLAEIPVEDKNSRLKIEFTDKTGGNYPIYNSTTGQLLSRLEETKDRSFKAVFNDNKNQSYFNGNEILIWKIPVSNSMILMNESFYLEEELLDQNDSIFQDYGNTIAYENGYIYIKRESVNGYGSGVNVLQPYKIAPYYNKGRTTNTVWCYVIKNNEIYQTAVTLMFNQHGTCGTDYTFTLGLGPKIVDRTPEQELGQDQPPQEWVVVGPSDTALTIGDTFNGEDAYHEILFDLYNSKNEKIDLTLNQKSDIINSWTSRIEKGYYSGRNNASNLDFKTGYGENEGRVIVRAKDVSIENLKYIVLQAFVRSEVEDENNNIVLGDVEFYQYLPIHIRQKNTDWELNGSDYIIYDDKGANPTCYNDKFELISKSNNDKIADGFEIIYDDNTISETWYPYINNAGKIQTPPLYVESMTKNIALIGKNSNDAIIYTCPIVIITNKYQIPAINKWDGELLIDADGNKILASMVGAGRKNPEGNTFDGVLMGEIEYKDDYTGQIKNATGLFGYDKSERAFGFDINGEAFIGKPDVGRIYVNGSTGRITSSAREAYIIDPSDGDPRGTEINLKENYIDIQGITQSREDIGTNDENQSRIHIDTEIRTPQNGGTNAYFSVDSNRGKRLIHIANDDYYLQTEDYPSSQIEVATQDGGTTMVTRPSGLKIDLKNGSFDSKGKLTISGNSESSINFGNNNFLVDGTGKLLTKNIEATGGSIDNITVKTLNFQNLDSNGNPTGTLTTGIRPRWMTFVTDISGTINKSTVPVSVAITKTVYVPYSYTDHVTTTVPINASGLFQAPGKPISGSITGGGAYLTVSSETSPFFIETPGDAISVSVTGTQIASLNVATTKYDSAEYTDTWRGQTDYEVVTSISLKVSKVSMWALTNNSATTSTVTIE